ncbi:PAS domain S-box protein [Marinobacter halodurans]|uniref:PAS domain S-box protein n=1 Tax=Marinobacter halodurans TaxID=2528979 RepID=A0ABY1ZNF8_9GAMM|nr:PAS domain S-box protein [Marinobacter halodurans]TBW54871.1 PAS domain S-box protein [Marinobacter halodurans]
MERPAGRGMHVWLPLLVLIVGLLCTGAVDHWTRKSLDKQTRALLESQHAHFTDLVQQAINVRLQTLDVLARTLSGLSDHSRIFQNQSDAILRRLPDVIDLDRIVTLSDAERAVVERNLSNASGQYITFGQWQESGITRVAPRQADYQVVVQVADRHPPSAILGLVAPSVPHWRQPIETALQHDKVSATAQTRIQRNGSSQVGVRLFRALEDGSLVSLAFSPEQLLREALPAQMDPALQVTVFDLDQHVKIPLFATGRLEQPRQARALRSAISLADREWILTTIPDRHYRGEPVERVRQIIWLVGVAASLGTTLLVGLLCLRLTRARHDHAFVTRALETESQALENNRIEKHALKQALQNSEQRSRDLVEIAGSCIAEMDEEGRIGFISALAVDFLGQPPAALEHHPFSDHVMPEDRERFKQGLAAARQQRRLVRMDLLLQDNDSDGVPVTLRLKPVVDTLTGCAGFRLSIQARPGQPEEDRSRGH